MYFSYTKSPMFLVILSACLVGCRSQQYPEGMPKPVPLTLTFLQEEKPLAGATVSLFPEDPESKWFAGGTTENDGSVLPMIQGRYAGVVPGRYKIVVYKHEYAAAVQPNVSSETAPAPLRDAYHLVDPRYAESETTPLSIEVNAAKTRETYDLGKAVRTRAAHKFP